ncbi:MAG: monothiol glutaredoxin, Grx4 family [Deltaproteobacteria bacterium RIFCSPLOWO2_12_FULL_44_12]|nr:MAG: monothiol glutaredoxin, Grx4 family [Deltaproteobacteria bacterium RIFCSPHIGHO2_01_FULL_43_49]OGQ15932.1 MAG: monothiol glutaredoxin, Grx4 family [Deltaproteobacteria bacterium RIFCSPHIGHO2_02_FULL_44_53]OGQ28894.1 MAG: monothiol glutaredoxin, Grx4 family [Deltaproteobacteria bacterium RIFCSPHIGHO2_12_FULL_44_21]OGQ30986.1 MAG: monothiol glutaredoxin, Grx4 family [Deltaproteobacteria bacterium RIFCSPLOWO2_01_FULL_45_74]OGQ44061.1 MAG: monothiol glutaredoxin, Grx4 family [Deltaproteobact
MSNVKEQIENDIKTHKIVLYLKGTPEMPQCGFSAATVECFKKLGVKFHAVNILEDVKIRQGVKEYTNWPTIPQVFINGKFIGGCDITKELFENGELKKMVMVEGETKA